MSFVEGPEDIVLQSIKGGDLIGDIDRTLTGFMQCDISSEFCATLLVPFLKHAAENNQLTQDILVYSRIFQDIYIYVLKDDPSNDQLLIEAQQSLLELQSFLTHESITEITYLSSLRGLAPIKILTIMDSILNFISPLLSKNIIRFSEPIVSVVWDAIPIIIMHLVKLRYPKDTLLKALVDSIKNSLEGLKHTYPSRWTVTSLLQSLLVLWDQGGLDEKSKDEVADVISAVVVSAPEADQGDFLELDALTVPITIKEASTCNGVQAHALFCIFCFLVKNHVKPQIIEWPDERSLHSLSHVREKVALFFESNQKEMSSQYMEVDLNSMPTRNVTRSQLGCFQQALQDQLEKITRMMVNMREHKFDISREDLDQLMDSMKEAVIISGNTDWEDLFYNQMEHVVPLIIYLLTADEAEADSITHLFGHDVNGFLIYYMHFALYYALISDEEGALLRMATTIDMTVENMCIEHGHHLVIALMKEEDQAVKKFAIRRLNNV
ncbi:hypothetical protein A0J61_08329, partial [Choanephora cucurbitarum]